MVKLDPETQKWVDLVERNKLEIANAIRRCIWSDDRYYRAYQDNVPIIPLRSCKIEYGGKVNGEPDIREIGIVYGRILKEYHPSLENEVVAIETTTLDGLLAVDKI